MDIDEYQKAACRTAKHYDNLTDGMAHLALGIAGEAGEVADLVKKIVAHGHDFDRTKLLTEIGDVMWYCAALSRLLMARLSDVTALNISKLEKRYAEGFSEAASQQRTE